jgi:hypothetical protein
MTSTNDALEYLMGGAPTLSFKELGTVHKGKIRSYEKTQQRDMDSGSPKVWENGEPMWQIVFTLETDERDPELDGDDGVRRLFAKAQMLTAIRDAIRKSGHRGDVKGGVLAVKYQEDGPAKTRGFNPPKVYAARFEAPVQTEDFEEVFEQDGEPYDPETEPF